MARINIDIGVLGNAATGDTLRTAMSKINTNFVEVYSLIADGSSGLIATDVTNGDLKLQANGTGVIEIDQLQVSGDAITSIVTNGSVDITGNGTGGVNIEALTFNGTSISSSDSSRINLNENVTVDGDLLVTGSISGTFTVSSLDADSSTVSNLEVDNFKASAIVIESEGISSNDNDTTLPTSAAVKDYVDTNSVTASETATFTNKTFDANGTGNSISNIEVADFAAASIVTEAEGIGSNDNDTTLPTSAAVKDYVDARDIGDLSVVGSTISAPSNADLTLTTSGTGSVSIDGIQISGTELSSSDSTQITIKENLHVTGNITGTLTGSVAFSNVTSTPTTLSGYGITDAASSTATALTVVGDDSSGTAVTLGETFKVAGATGITTAVSGDTLTITGPTLTSYITASSSDTLTNKTIDANGTGNSISNLEVADFAGSAIINVAETLASNDSDTALVTAGAIIDYVDAQDANIASDTLTFTNKTFDVEGTGNSISNIDVADFKAAAIVTAAEGIGSNNNDTTIPTSAAVKAYADSVGGGGGSTGDLTISGSTISAPSNADLTLNAGGTGSVDIDGIQIKGTSISSTDSTQININENVNIDGTLTVSGSTLSGTLNTAGNTGTGSVALASESLQVTGTTNEINVEAAAFALSLSLADDISGITSVTAGSFLANDAIKIIDNKITGTRSNENVELQANGTGSVIAQSPFVAQSPVTFNAGYIEKINTLTSSSTITVDCSAASIHTVTLATATEFNITNLPTGGSVTLIITQDGTGSRTATFGTDGSSAVKFPSNSSTLSTGAGDIDVVTIVNDGTNFLGNIAKDYRSS